MKGERFKKILFIFCAVILIALCVLLPFLGALKGEDLTASAEDNISLYTDPILTIDSNDSFSNIAYIHLSGSTVPDSYRLLRSVRYVRFPLFSVFTAQVNVLGLFSDLQVNFSGYAQNGTLLFVTNVTNSNVSVNSSSYPNLDYIQFDIYSLKSSSTPVGYNVDLFVYEGSYSFSRAVDIKLGYLQGFGEGNLQGYDSGYKVGHSEGYNLKVSESLNPLSLFLSPAQDFINAPLFGNFSIGDAFSVFLFVAVALIFIKMFAGG